MTALRLRIGRIALELDDAVGARQTELTLRTALELLARRLAGLPYPNRAEDVTTHAMSLLQVDPIAPDQLVGPGGAARLADELYRRILAEVRS